MSNGLVKHYLCSSTQKILSISVCLVKLAVKRRLAYPQFPVEVNACGSKLGQYVLPAAMARL